MPKTKLVSMLLFLLLVIPLAHEEQGIHKFLKLITNIKIINNGNLDILESYRLIEKEILSLIQ